MEILTSLIVLFSLVASLSFVADYCHRQQAHGATQQVQQLVQEAENHAGAAQANDAQAEAIQAKLAATQQSLVRLRAEAEALRKALAERPEVSPAVGPDPHDALIAKQDEVIKAQDAQIAGLQGQVVLLTAARDQWKAAFDTERKARMAQEAATLAWQQAVGSSKRIGQFQGLALGLAVGYVGGRLK